MRAQIVVNLTDMQLMHTTGCITAMQTWEALCTIHEPAHILLGQYSVGDLWATCTSEDMDITEHIANLTNIHHTLIQNQQYISDADFKNILLDSVPHSWEPFISALNAQDSMKKMMVNQLKMTIMEEYLR